MSVIVRDVSKRMGKNDVLRNVSIEVDPGTVVGLQGINGSGKTMLMRAVCGLIKPTEGEISIDGQRLGADISFPPSLGMLIEAPSFLGYLSGYDNLELIAQIKGVATPEDIRSALRQHRPLLTPGTDEPKAVILFLRHRPPPFHRPGAGPVP